MEAKNGENSRIYEDKNSQIMIIFEMKLLRKRIKYVVIRRVLVSSLLY